MTSAAQRPEHLFIVRIWLEPDTVANQPQWRGSVEHSITRQRFYFSNPTDLAIFVTTFTTGVPPQPIDAQE